MKKLLLLLLFSANCHALGEIALTRSDIDFAPFLSDSVQISFSQYAEQPLTFTPDLVGTKPYIINSTTQQNWNFVSNEVVPMLLIESVAAAYSYWASKDPATAGTFLGLSGLFLLDMENRKVGAVGALTLGALGLYNINIDEDEKSEGEIFRDNMIGVNLIFLSMATTELLFPRLQGDISIYPQGKDTWFINYQYRF
ncbi:hypothetical protein BOO92_14660 [Vibrio navarrensis]|uniref:hypothetical protein n=1 Tax=Vibrio navarrensis TaxID=29495 RepID=UPI001865CBE7|nr:hypothetical protein [Vibrio navarrensis]MBE3651492.1 hypothetical protein [Vibrio navarrensis]MBE3657917.1 hypothetical protein [Vibrio navarrensis]